MYAKVFTSLFDGSMRGKSDLILVFINLLCHANKDGIVDRHWKAIADETGLTVDCVKLTLTVLESVDTESRSSSEEGKRLLRIDDHREWGWKIVNYEHYRKLRTDDQKRSYMRDYMREKRAKEKMLVPVNPPLVPVNPDVTKLVQAEAEAEANVKKEIHDSEAVAPDDLSGLKVDIDSRKQTKEDPVTKPPIFKTLQDGLGSTQGSGQAKVHSKPRPKAIPKQTWLTAYNEIHIEAMGGELKNMGQAARDFKALELRYPREQVLDGWRRHLASEGKFASIASYACKPLQWMTKPTETVDLNVRFD